MKKFIIFFIFIPLVYSELHTFKAAYSSQRFSGIPEFIAVTTLDGHQIDYYDSNIKKLIPKQDWMKKITSTDMWIDYIEIIEKQQQIYKNNINVLMETFNQSQGVHTYQRMYGCVWDDETGYSQGFDQYGYDGEDFISLDLKENRYITSVPQASPTVMKWNNDKTQLEYLKQYYDYECVYWLKELLHLSKATSKKTDPPKVSLLQKNLEEYVECHVTGFLFNNTSILWRKNGQTLSDPSNLVESGDTLPNEDGTFQRRVTLYVLPNIWKKNQYTCVVEHKSLTEPIQTILTEGQINHVFINLHQSSYIMYLVPVIIILVGLFVLWKCRKKLKACYKKTTSCSKSKPAGSQNSLLYTPSNESSSLQKPEICE
ncbi:unnamed protein product [Leuciscus chuanchicus]